MQWHDEGHKKDGMLHHPANEILWMNFERKDKEFKWEIRNIIFGLGTERMNPFGDT
jgi:hypothetical protein